MRTQPFSGNWVQQSSTTDKCKTRPTSARAGTSSFFVEMDDAQTCGRFVSVSSSTAILHEVLVEAYQAPLCVALSLPECPTHAGDATLLV